MFPLGAADAAGWYCKCCYLLLNCLSRPSRQAHGKDLKLRSVRDHRGLFAATADTTAAAALAAARTDSGAQRRLIGRGPISRPRNRMNDNAVAAAGGWRSAAVPPHTLQFGAAQLAAASPAAAAGQPCL